MDESTTLPLPSWPTFAADEVDAAASVLGSGKINYWTGQEGREFEREFAEYVGTTHAIALANGTAALEVALEALHIGPGDDVIVPSCTFIATASAVVMRGARPVVADIDAQSLNITAETIATAMTARTRAIIVVHVVGWPCDLDPIMALARRAGIYVIEDCAQANGAQYKGRPVGSIGDIGTFSFCQDKIMTTGGEGGMLVTSNETAWANAWSFKDHGKSFDAVYNRNHPPGFRWVHEGFGTNLRLTEMQSAIGRHQLRKLDDWSTQRRRNAGILIDSLRTHRAIDVPVPTDGYDHAYYKFYVFLRRETLAPNWNQRRIIESLSGRGVPCFSGICTEIYREKAFVDAGLGPSQPLPTAAKRAEETLLFLVHPTLTASHMTWMASQIHAVLNEAIGAA